MKYPTTEEYLNTINGLVRIQNIRTKNYFDIDAEAKNAEKEKFTNIVRKYKDINKYVATVLFPALLTIKKNEKYIFQYFDDEAITTEGKSSYFKIIIRNKIRNITNFIIVSYTFRDFIVKVKPANADSDVEVETTEFKLEKFSRGKLRKILFEYLQEIITLDTLPRKRKSKETENEDNKIADLQAEIERMKRLSIRNQEMIAKATETAIKIK
jgi:hypothetical protein